VGPETEPLAVVFEEDVYHLPAGRKISDPADWPFQNDPFPRQSDKTRGGLATAAWAGCQAHACVPALTAYGF